MLFDDLTAVVVDDSEYCCSLLGELTKMLGFQVRSFLSPLEALNYVREHTVDIVFTDFKMPKMDGLTFFIRETRKAQRDIPIVMVTGEPDAVELKEFSPADIASEVFVKPLYPEDFFARVRPLALLRQYQKFVSTYRLKEDEFGNHRLRVGHYSKIISAGLKWDVKEQDSIYYAAQLHDIGMISIPDHIIFKAGRLTRNEMDLVRKHTSIGCRILQENSNPFLKMASAISLTHHERFNGSGYPLGLSGNAIPIAGQITALADVFDVLTSSRPYKEAWNFKETLCFIGDNKDMHFDPGIVNVFVESVDRIKEVYTSLADEAYVTMPGKK